MFKEMHDFAVKDEMVKFYPKKTFTTTIIDQTDFAFDIFKSL